MIRCHSASRNPAKRITDPVRFHVSRGAPLVCLFVLLLGVNISGAGTVTGQFKLKSGGMIAPEAATAYPVREQYNARTESVEIMLSKAPFNVDPDALNPHVEAINQEAVRQDNYILLWVTRDGQVSMNATFVATMSQYLDKTGAGGGLKAILTTNAPERIAGRILTPEPVKVMSGDSYMCDMTFEVDVVRPTAGTPLPPGGGEPGRAFVAMMASAKKKNWPALRDSVSEGFRKLFDADYRTPEENMEYAIGFLQMSLPKTNRKVTRGTLRGTVATLEIEGDMFPGQKAVYFVRMVKSKGAWLFDGAALAGLVKQMR